MAVVLAAAAAPAQETARSRADWFRVSWETRAYGAVPTIGGWIRNGSPFRVSSVRVRIEGFDANHRAVGEGMAWAIGDIDPGGQCYFVAPALPGAADYGISVMSFDLIAGGG